MRMTAAVLFEQGKLRPFAASRPLEILDVDLDAPGEGEVLIEIAGAGLCHSDLSVINNQRPRSMPVVPGHEGAGIVREVGRGVSDLRPGDHVITLFVPSCGHCRFCAGGRPNLCEQSTVARSAGTLPGGERRLKYQGRELNHYSCLSVFAQFAVVHRSSLFRIDKDVPLDDAAILGCAVVTGVGAVLNTADVQIGSRMAVVGLGGVGMNAILAGRIAGAGRIVAIDINAEKLKLALELGATDAFLATDGDCAARVREATDGGADDVFDTAGTMPAMKLGLDITARGGTLVSAGLPHAEAQFTYLHAPLVTEERSIKGCYMGSLVPQRDIPRILSLYRQGKLPLHRLRSGEIGFDGLNAGFDRLAEGEALRTVLRPRG